MPASAVERLISLWALERQEARERFAAERREVPLAERVRRGLALRDLCIDETGAAPGGRTLLWLAPRNHGDLDGLRVGPGDPVRLWWGELGGPDAEGAVPGIVARRQARRLGIVLEGDVPEPLDEADGGLRLDREEQQATFDRGDRALGRLLGAPRGSPEEALRELLFSEGAGRPRLRPARAWTPLDAGLNEAQREAVELALGAEDLALIHGPPGTGKTRTLVEVVRQAAARGERVLCTAASNTPVDNLAERLVEAGVRLLRLGHPARVAPAVEEHTLDAAIEGSDDYALAQRWLRAANAIRRRVQGRRNLDRSARRAALREANALCRDARRQLAGLQEAILARTPVLCATAAGAEAAVLAEWAFDLVVLDEATQVPDPVALCALLRAPRAVLAGDPQQLPPTVLSAEAERRGLGRTFFERLARQPERVRMLQVQHRMHRALMAFPSASQYGGRLVAAPAVAQHGLAELGVAEDPLRPGPLVFIDTAGKGWEERRGGADPSTDNPGHAERACAELRRLLGRGLPAADVALITPYDAQLRLLSDRLAAERAAGLELGTVDGFQGREKEAVLIDLVRSNDAGELGFLGDTRRMNVALTRARRFLLVLGDSSTLGRHPYYAAFLRSVEENGVWLSAWSDDAPAF